MRIIDQYHKWVEWSEEDRTYIGKCPDLITGIHGNDPGDYMRNCAKRLNQLFSIFSKKSGLPSIRETNARGSVTTIKKAKCGPFYFISSTNL